MYELTFTLQQHTPIIHFQHDQEGATLRATEVKPKLDRYIWGKWAEVEMGTEEEKKEKLFKKYGHLTTGFTTKQWEEEVKKFEKLDIAKKKTYLKNFKWALDYKIRISRPVEPQFYLFESQFLNDNKARLLNEYYEDEVKSTEICSPSSLFANTDKIKFSGAGRDLYIDKSRSKMEEVRLALDSASFKVYIVSWKQNVIAIIREYISSFFVLENFGTRQSKGFGCYCAKTNPLDDKTIGIAAYEKLLKNNFKAVFRKELSDNESWYQVIQEDYKLLKSGRGSGERGGYEKSDLFHYFANQPVPVRWEKRWLKIEINKLTRPGQPYTGWTLLCTHAPKDLKEPNNWNDDTLYEHKYIRALLGLAEQFEFLTGSPGGNSNKFVAQVSHSSIERFRSPITFKIFDRTLYLCANEIRDGHPILNEQFQIHFTRKGVRDDPSIPRPDFPPTPASFNLPAFLEKALTEYGIIEGYAKI